MIRSFFIILTIIYTVSFIYWLLDRNIELDTLKYGEIVTKFSSQAVIINDAYVIKKSSIGNIQYLYQDGERVNKYSELMYIFPENFQGLYNRLVKIQNEIIGLKKILTDPKEITNNQIKKMKAKRDDIILEIFRDDNTIAELGILNDLLIKENNNIIEKKYSLIEANNDVISLEKEVDDAYLELKNNNFIITAPETGVFSSKVDGYETISAREQLAAMSVSRIKEVILEPKGKKYSDDAVGKLIISEDYFFVMEINEVVYSFISDKEYIKVIFPGIPEPFYTINHKIIIQQDGKYLLILKTNKYLELLANKRTISLDIMISSDTGIKIPRQVTFDTDQETMTTHIFISRNGNILKHKVNIVSQDIDDMIIYSEDLKISDLLVKEPKKAREGMFIK